MDKPDLIVACIVGDGEAETGPTATAWHAHKYIDPAESGAVLPIVNANGEYNRLAVISTSAILVELLVCRI